MSLKQWKFTNGYEPYETLPSVSSDDNGKVLGVSEGQYALVSGGGGGSVTPLLVTLTITTEGDTELWVFDKTFAEVKEAYLAGRPVIVITHTEGEDEGNTFTDDYYRPVVTVNEATLNDEFYIGVIICGGSDNEFAVSDANDYPTYTTGK